MLSVPTRPPTPNRAHRHQTSPPFPSPTHPRSHHRDNRPDQNHHPPHHKPRAPTTSPARNRPIAAAHAYIAWSHKGRCRNAAFARLAGVAPLEASSGQHTRHRLNRHGDRQLNQAIHTIAITRSRDCPTTRAYINKRTTQGKTTPKPAGSSNATSPDKSTDSSKTPHQNQFDKHRSVTSSPGQCKATPTSTTCVCSAPDATTTSTTGTGRSNAPPPAPTDYAHHHPNEPIHHDPPSHTPGRSTQPNKENSPGSFPSPRPGSFPHQQVFPTLGPI